MRNGVGGSFTGEWGFWHQAPRSPEAIGAAILSAAFGSAAAGFTIGATSITLASVLGYGLFAAGSIGLQYAVNSLTAKPGQAVSSDVAGQTIKQATPSRWRSYGEVKIGGKFAFVEKGGPVPSVIAQTPNLWNIVLQGQGEIASVQEHWIGDQQVVLDENGATTDSNPGHDSGATPYPAVYIENKLGTKDQTPFAYLTTVFPSEVNSALFTIRWRTVPATLIVLGRPGPDAAAAQKLYPQPGGPSPLYRAVQHSSKVYDPRDEGMEPDGDADDPTANGWLYSDTAALIILDFLRHPDGFASRSEREMVPISQFHIPDWIAFADLCEEEVERKDGSGPINRYRIWGTYDLTSPPKNILQGMLDSCDAELYRTGTGKIGIRGGKWDEPTASISNNDLLSHSLKKGSRQYSSCNRINAKYVSRHHDYQQVDMDPWIDDGNIELRRQELTIDLDLPWVPHHSQARRLAKIQMAKRNPAWLGTIVTGPRGLLAYNQRTINVVIDELGIDRPFLVTSFRPSPNFATVEIGIASLDSAAYDWDEITEEGDAPKISAITEEESEIPPPFNVAVEVSETDDPDVVSLVLSWENTSFLTLFGHAQYQDATDSGFNDIIAGDVGFAGLWIDLDIPEDAGYTSPILLDSNRSYIFRVRHITPAIKASAWSESVTAGSGFILREDGTELMREDGELFLREAA